MVTNMGVPTCAAVAAQNVYVNGVTYAIQKLGRLPNVGLYLDIGHSGWAPLLVKDDDKLSRTGTHPVFSTLSTGVTSCVCMAAASDMSCGAVLPRVTAGMLSCARASCASVQLHFEHVR